MTPQEFIAKWQAVKLSERSACQQHSRFVRPARPAEAAAADPEGARDEACARELKKRTLTNLYNLRPSWLELAHRRLDEAVFAASWPMRWAINALSRLTTTGL